jgi:hypothetical protein
MYLWWMLATERYQAQVLIVFTYAQPMRTRHASQHIHEALTQIIAHGYWLATAMLPPLACL